LLWFVLAQVVVAAAAISARAEAPITAPASAAESSPVEEQSEPALATPMSWTYQTYDSNAANAAGYGGPGVSYLRLDGQAGDYRITIVAPGLATCFAAPLRATVRQTASVLVITTQPRLPGCDEVRFVIANDGTGGRREVRRAGQWRWDRLERGMTLRK
jgi:hypothetical protein